MSLHTNDHQQSLQEIRTLFTEAEQAIKEVEDTGGELIVPAVNQLRYTGNHLIRYLSNPASDTAEAELTDAAKHCKRATYDAYEAAILNQLMEYSKFKDDYRNVQITSVISDYPEIADQIEQARTFARNNNESKTRGEFYQAGREHLQTIVKNVGKLNACREELNKQIIRDNKEFLRDRRNFIFQIIAAAGVGATVVGVILSYLRC